MSHQIDEQDVSKQLKHTVEPVITVEPIYEAEKTLYGVNLDDISVNAKTSQDEPQYDYSSEEFADIPELVQKVVGFEDDATLPVLTFRSILLSAIFCIIGSFVSQLS